MKRLYFRHRIIDDAPLGAENDILLVEDVDGDGLQDIIMGAKYVPPERTPADAHRPNIAWYQAPDWKRRPIGYGELEAGGVTLDLTGNGLPDLVAGEQGRGKHLYWWENPGPKAEHLWKRRLITNAYERYHDQAVGDIDGDGEPELVFLSQNSRLLIYADIPADPTVEPWPEDCFHVIADDIAIEGLRIVDIDGDGVNEILAGHTIFKRTGDPTQPWTKRELLPHLEWARVAVGDLTGNGHLDIVLSEAEKADAKILWLEGPDFETVHELGDGYIHLHSLELADFNGDGKLDIFTAEMHLNKTWRPRMFVFRNLGNGQFDRYVIHNPAGCHEGKLIQLEGSERPSILSKPYLPNRRLDLWANITGTAQEMKR